LVLSRAGRITIENLTGSGDLVEKRFLLSCFPPKLIEADGCPVRAIAILES
jgi:kynurenine formamidase